MCDYSLQNVASRPATIGDNLVITEFPGSYTRGFSAIDKPDVAVCLLPGTEVAFEHDAECDHVLARLFRRFSFGQVGSKVARFRQVDTHRWDVHHDALEFSNGKIVLLTSLSAGQRATILQLPVQASESKVRPKPVRRHIAAG